MSKARTFLLATAALLASGPAFAQVPPPLGNFVEVNNSSGNVAAGTATATLPAALGKITYLTGFNFTSSGATGASVVTCTITGLVGGTRSYTLAVVAGATLGNQPLGEKFVPPLSASAPNTAIAASCPSLGAGSTNAAVNAEGLQR
jgi:hypothetical protein